MTKEEIKKWFWNKFNSCYLVKHKDYKEKMYLIYDPQFIRQKKLCRITGEELKYPKNVKGQWLFYLNLKYGYFDSNYEYIWSFLEKNYSSKYMDIRNLIKEVLKEYDKLSVIIPSYFLKNFQMQLKENDKLSILTPAYAFLPSLLMLKENDKLNVLTPRCRYDTQSNKLKLSVVKRNNLHR